VTTVDFCLTLNAQGFNFATGVPCSIFKDIILYLSSHSDIPYIPATREDEALGIATGAYLGGKKPVVFMQNSGLGSAINPLSSLNMLYRIPILLLISWRGYRGKDAPEHLIMGKVTTKLLKDIGVPVQVITKDDPEAAILASIRQMEEKQIPAAAVLKAGIIQ